MSIPRISDELLATIRQLQKDYGQFLGPPKPQAKSLSKPKIKSEKLTRDEVAKRDRDRKRKAYWEKKKSADLNKV